jgi:hypothetical protein
MGSRDKEKDARLAQWLEAERALQTDLFKDNSAAIEAVRAKLDALGRGHDPAGDTSAPNTGDNGGPAMPPGFEVALAYLARGWRPVPIPFQQKKPVLDSWQTLVLIPWSAARYFNGGPQNIGVVLGRASGGLTDVDLEWREAIALAKPLLDCSGEPGDVLFEPAAVNPRRLSLLGRLSGAGPGPSPTVAKGPRPKPFTGAALKIGPVNER